MSNKPFFYTLLVSFTLVLFSTFYATAGVSTSTIVVPNANEDVEGNAANSSPLDCNLAGPGMESQRYQQMYASSEFGGSCFITEIRFRRNGTSGSDFGPTDIPNITIQLSSSPNTISTMSSTFADNIGSDVETVFQGDLTLSTSCGSQVPCPFDQVIPLQQGFLYTPSNGDLLIDFRIPTCADNTAADASGVNVIARAGTSPNIGDVNDPEADFISSDSSNTKGLVTQFVCGESPSGPIVIIPTLSQWGIIIVSLILGLAAVLMLRRRTES